MKTFQRTSQFKQDTKRMVKRGKNFTIFKKILQSLADGEKLETK